MKNKIYPYLAIRNWEKFKKELGKCSGMVELVDTFVREAAKQVKHYEHQIKLLTAENCNLRHALKTPDRKEEIVEIDFPFIFPGLSDTPVEVLRRSIEEILPLTDNMDGRLKGIRSRVVHFSMNRGWSTLDDFLRDCPKADGPLWKEVRADFRRRNFGEVSLWMLKASLNHFKVDRKNLPS